MQPVEFFSWKRTVYHSYAFNTVAAADSVMHGAKATAAMVLTYLSEYSGHSTRRVKVLTWVPALTLIYMYNIFSRFSSESTLMLPIWHNGICPTYVNYGVKTMNTSVMLVLISWPDDLTDGWHAEPSKVKITPYDLITYSYRAAKV